MTRENPLKIQSEKYIKMSLSAKDGLSSGRRDGIEICFKHLSEYTEQYGSQEDKNELGEHKRKYKDLEQKARLGTEDQEYFNRMKSNYNWNINKFIDELRPNNEFIDEVERTLRVWSEWDSADNLEVFLQLEQAPQIDTLFQKLLTDKKWKGLIREERRWLHENGEAGELIPDDMELDYENDDFQIIDCKTEDAVRFDLRNVDGGVSAGLLIEIFEKELQICISANGSVDKKREFLNDLLAWFRSQFEKMKIAPISFIIPRAKSFFVDIKEEETKIQNCTFQVTQTFSASPDESN